MSEERKMPADWAINEAYDRGDEPSQTPYLQLARMIEKYEPELAPAPVDSDVLALREILVAWMNEEFATQSLRAGYDDNHPDFLAALAAYRKVKS
jgi:hypothetical protein